MSYQLIHTKSKKLLHAQWWENLLSREAKYGIVAQSVSMPQALVRNLESCSRFNYEADVGTHDPQYAYRVDVIGGHIFHILSCVRYVDDKEDGDVIAHHLALRADEVQKLWRDMNFPTPAGVIMTLEKEGFWATSWDAAPGYLDTDFIPSLRENMGETEQTTWAALSGHKSNALAFRREPYDKGCLVVTPLGTDSMMILNLLHESDVLSPELGWGQGFCTHGFSRDVPNGLMRIFTTDATPLVDKAVEEKFPVLNVFVGLDIQKERWGEASSVKPPPAPSFTTMTPSTNFAPVTLMEVKAIPPRRQNWFVSFIRAVWRVIFTFICDVKDFVVSIFMGVFIVALVVGAVGGLIYVFIRYIIPAIGI